MIRLPRIFRRRARARRSPGAAPAIAHRAMQTLAPREAYESSDGDAGERLPVFSGGLLNGGLDVLHRVERVRGRVAWPVRVAVSAVAGGVSAVVLNVLLPHSVLWWGRRVTDQVYAGDPRILPPPPSAGYTYRLPCGRMIGESYAVGGVLYLGARGIRFDPHRRNRRRDRASLVIEPLAGVQVDMVDAPLPRWAWWREGARRIRVRWPEGEAHFSVPHAAEVYPRLADHVRALAPTRSRPVS